MSVAHKVITNEILQKNGLSVSENLRQYQLEGVQWLSSCHNDGHGAMLCDEMGLGKTCQAVCFILLIKSSPSAKKPSLVLCPLTVLDNWKQELKRFAPKLSMVTYIGDQDTRSRARKTIRKSCPDVILSSYELCLKESYFFERLQLDCIIVDEGHRLKNSESMLYKAMEEYNRQSCILLTGTPVQNNLDEFYSLLSFVCPDKFPIESKKEFTEKYKNLKKDKELSAELQKMIKPYVLRRTKAQVALDIPDKHEVTIHHPLSDLQKKYYKALLMKDLDAFENEASTSRMRLLNLLQQLRKCVDHPYMFDGVEPEPFQLGEHLVEASGKLVTLDRILAHVKSRGHKVLIFSQMTHMLDILQDYLHYRGYTYERLDGSVRGEERFTAIRNFNSTSDTFVFLLSSRAGGQGLNLVSADTVIFYDHDFNPQVDLQAAARAHRIGQTRPVKIIRLVAKATVEEVILSRAQAKLRLTQSVMSSDTDADEDEIGRQTIKDLQKILKSGLSSLLSDDDEDNKLVIEDLIGETVDMKWVIPKEKLESVQSQGTSATNGSQDDETIYQYEGKDYSKEFVKASKDDDAALQQLIDEVSLGEDDPQTSSRSRRSQPALASLSLPVIKTRKPLTPEQLEARKRAREKAIAQRRAEAEERHKLKEHRKLEKWKKVGYVSCSLPQPSEEDLQAMVNDEEDEDKDISYMHYITGDVTQPCVDKCIVVHCVDNSGSWGSGGVFTAVSAVTKSPEKQYELASDMKDVHEGDVHLVSCEDVSDYQHYKVALLIAQDRNLKVKQASLKSCLNKLAQECKSVSGWTVHLPRLGYNTPNFDWYSTERQIRRCLCDRGIHTYIYYYKRKAINKRQASIDSCPSNQKALRVTDSRSPSPRVSSPEPSSSCMFTVSQGVITDLFANNNFVLDSSLSHDEKRKLLRYIIAYDGSIQPTESDDTHYVVTVEPVDCIAAQPVKPEYIFDCICYNKVLPVSESYLVT